MRNLGGSFGIALVGTILTQRTTLHYSQLVTHISLTDAATAEKFQGMQYLLMQKGHDLPSSKFQALRMIASLSQGEAMIQSFNDVFFLLEAGLIFCLALTMFLGKVDPTRFDEHHGHGH